MSFDLPTALILLAGGLAIGAALAIFGGGGRLLALPLLIAVGVAPRAAVAGSLLVVAGTAAVAAAAPEASSMCPRPRCSVVSRSRAPSVPRWS